MYQPIKSFAVIATMLVLTACQTTQGFDKERVVELSETDIVLPAGLLELEGFKIKEAKISETGSYRRDSVSFTGGFFSFHRYFRGGIRERTPDTLRRTIAKYFTNFEIIGDVQNVNTQMGTAYYATVSSSDTTCVVMSGNFGIRERLRNAFGYPGLIRGEYCEPGHKPELSKIVLEWMHKVRLKS